LRLEPPFSLVPGPQTPCYADNLFGSSFQYENPDLPGLLQQVASLVRRAASQIGYCSQTCPFRYAPRALLLRLGSLERLHQLTAGAFVVGLDAIELLGICRF